MRFFSNKGLSILVVLFTGVFGYAAPVDPPQPTPPPPPGLPIDGGLLILFIISVLFGIYKIYQYNINKKTPA